MTYRNLKIASAAALYTGGRIYIVSTRGFRDVYVVLS